MYDSNYIINHPIILDKRLVQYAAADAVKLLVPVSALVLVAVRELYPKGSAHFVYSVSSSILYHRRKLRLQEGAAVDILTNPTDVLRQQIQHNGEIRY